MGQFIRSQVPQHQLTQGETPGKVQTPSPPAVGGTQGRDQGHPGPQSVSEDGVHLVGGLPSSHPNHLLWSIIWKTLAQEKRYGKFSKISGTFLFLFSIIKAGPCSGTGNVSSCRYMSDCRSRGHKFYPGPVPYFCGD